jgi:hypothetical protein
MAQALTRGSRYIPEDRYSRDPRATAQVAQQNLPPLILAPQQQQQSGGAMGGMDPSGLLNMFGGGGETPFSGAFGKKSGSGSLFGEGGSGSLFGEGGFSSLFGGGSSAAGGGGGAAAGAGGGAAGGGAAGAGGGSSAAGGLAAAWPAAIVAAIVGNELYQNNTGNRDGESFPLEYGLTGRAFYKDAPGWGEKADDIIPGLGSGIRTAGLLSSPVDLFRGDTYKGLWDEAKSGFGLFDLF